LDHAPPDAAGTGRPGSRRGLRESRHGNRSMGHLYRVARSHWERAMSETEQILGSYFQLMNLNGASHVYREAVRCGLLGALRSERQTAAQVAQACSLLAGPTELLLDALLPLGVVRKDGESYALTHL